MNLCRDCLHCIPDSPALTWAECDAVNYKNPVNGKPQRWFCWAARAPGGPCGPDASKFEPIETRTAA